MKITGFTTSRTATGRLDVIHGNADYGRVSLFELTEMEAEMAIQFLNEQEKENGEGWQKIQSRLLWADFKHRGLDKLLKPSLVHGGVTVQGDPLGLVVVDGRIMFPQAIEPVGGGADEQSNS